MAKAHILSWNIFSPLGKTAKENFDALCKNRTAVKEHKDAVRSDVPFSAALFPETLPERREELFTPFESILKASIEDALKLAGVDAGDADTALILSSTKGNFSKIEAGGLTEQLK